MEVYNLESNQLQRNVNEFHAALEDGTYHQPNERAAH